MAERPFWSAKHVRTLAELPKNLTLGRAYFVDDEHYIIIDHGAGPVIYGNRQGQQGIPGEPIPILQAQIDYLAEASINQTSLIDLINENRKKDDAKIKAEITANEAAHAEKYSEIGELISQKENESLERYKALQDESKNLYEALSKDIQTVDNRRYEDLVNIYASLDALSHSVISLAEITSTIAENLRGTENALLKLLIEDERVNPATPLAQNDVITTTDGYSWTVTELYNNNGEIDLILNLNQ